MKGCGEWCVVGLGCMPKGTRGAQQGHSGQQQMMVRWVATPQGQHLAGARARYPVGAALAAAWHHCQQQQRHTQSSSRNKAYLGTWPTERPPLQMLSP